MTISEVLVASCLFFGSLGASLQVWGVSASLAVAEEQRQERRERAEAELVASEARLRTLARALPPSSDCGSQARALREALEGDSPPLGLHRGLTSQEEGLLEVSVTVEGLAEPPRRRLWSAAAFGLCLAAPAASPEER